MVTAAEFTDLARVLAGTEEKPHFDRTAFRVNRTYMTLAADGLSANLKLTPDEQEFKVMLRPQAYSVIDNSFGRQGWTTCLLSEIDREEAQSVLQMAYAHAVPKTARR